MPIQIVRDRETFVDAERDQPEGIGRGVSPFSKCKVYSNRADAAVKLS
jgi:hypothetical protein